VKLTRSEREIGDVSGCRDKNKCGFFEKPSAIASESDCLLGQFERILKISVSVTGVKEKKSGGVQD